MVEKMMYDQRQREVCTRNHKINWPTLKLSWCVYIDGTSNFWRTKETGYSQKVIKSKDPFFVIVLIQMIDRFMEQHPEMDFSKAKFSWSIGILLLLSLLSCACVLCISEWCAMDWYTLLHCNPSCVRISLQKLKNKSWIYHYHCILIQLSLYNITF